MVGQAGIAERTVLGREVLDAIRDAGTVERFESGEILLERGTDSPAIFLIEEGEVSVSDDLTPPRTLRVGDLVGEAGFLDGVESSTVVARTPTVARRIRPSELAATLAPRPDVLYAVLDAIRSLRRAGPAASSAEQAVAELAAESLEHRAVHHPYLKALGQGTLPDLRWALQDFARHYYGYSRMFPRYLTTVLAKLEDPQHRAALLENLTEESGTYEEEEIATLAELGIQREWFDGIPHPDLFARFARALGVEPSADDESDEVVCWRELFLGILAQGSAAEAVGALGLGTENIVSTIYVPLVDAVSRVGLSGRDSVFFPLHTAVDDGHQEVLQAIAASFATTPEGLRDLRRGMLKALQCRCTFWDWLHERALARPPVERPLPARVVGLVETARSRVPLGAATSATGFVQTVGDGQAAMYRNHNERLNIDFSVEKFGFADLQTMDPRLVRIAPSCNNEFHKHAHESLFVILQGEGEVRIGDDWQRVGVGDVAFVPRWIFHQTRNLSDTEPLVMVAITDYGFTSAALGDYDKRTRLASGGDQVTEGDAVPDDDVAGAPELPPRDVGALASPGLGERRSWVNRIFST